VKASLDVLNCGSLAWVHEKIRARPPRWLRAPRFGFASEGSGRGHDVRLLPGLLVQEAGLSLFRWVFPRFHHNPGLEEWKKQQRDTSA
jgi:hypothetical protein